MVWLLLLLLLLWLCLQNYLTFNEFHYLTNFILLSLLINMFCMFLSGYKLLSEHFRSLFSRFACSLRTFSTHYSLIYAFEIQQKEDTIPISDKEIHKRRVVLSTSTLPNHTHTIKCKGWQAINYALNNLRERRDREREREILLYPWLAQSRSLCVMRNV